MKIKNEMFLSRVAEGQA